MRLPELLLRSPLPTTHGPPSTTSCMTLTVSSLPFVGDARSLVHESCFCNGFAPHCPNARGKNDFQTGPDTAPTLGQIEVRYSKHIIGCLSGATGALVGPLPTFVSTVQPHCCPPSHFRKRTDGHSPYASAEKTHCSKYHETTGAIEPP